MACICGLGARPPPGVRIVERRVGQGGRVNVAGQVFTASLAHVGRLLTVVIEEHQSASSPMAHR